MLQDPEDAGFLYDTIAGEVAPLFYDRNSDGLPAGWIARMRNAMKGLSYRFSAHRMITDYARSIYALPEEKSVA